MKNASRTTVLLLGDMLALGGAFVSMLSLSFSDRLNEEIFRLHALPFAFVGVLWIGILFICNLYTIQTTRLTISRLRQIFIACSIASAASAIFFYTLPFFDITPKTNLFIFAFFAFVFFILWRRIFYTIFSSYFRKRVAFITSIQKNKHQVTELTSYIKTYPQSGFSITGTYSSLGEMLEQATPLPDILIVSNEIWRDPKNFKALYNTQTEVIGLSYAYEDILGKIAVETIDEDWFMHNIDFSQKSVYNLGERISNVIVSFFILIVASPLISVLALLIKMSDGGPILYSQVRVGKGGKNFKLYKFRSMRTDAEKHGPEWSSINDSRVTPVGKILRALHLDELPQMWNVLIGDIALVGPRPERPEFVQELEKEIPFYHLRHIIDPGFTGWAQIKFRYARTIMDSKEKFEYDLYYIKNRNAFMDAGIILRTIQIIFTH